MTNPKLPLPGEPYDGGTVIASVWGCDDPDDGQVWALLLLLLPEPDYYRVVEIEPFEDGWKVTVRRRFPNIVPAVAQYVADGGGY